MYARDTQDPRGPCRSCAEMKRDGRKHRDADRLRRRLRAACSTPAASTCVLVGDSLGMVVQGHRSTLPVTRRGHRLPHRLRRARPVARVAGRGPSVPVRYATPERALDASTPLAARPARRWSSWKAPGHKLEIDPLPGRARHAGLRASRADPAVGAASSAATRCRVVTSRPPRKLRARCARGGRGRRRTAGAGMRAVARWPARSRRDRDSHDRHRRGRRLRRPGAGAARPARHQQRAIVGRASSRISSPAAVRSPAAIAAYVAAVRDGSFPDPRTRLRLMQTRSKASPTSRAARACVALRDGSASRSCRRWATCTQAISRW